MILRNLSLRGEDKMSGAKYEREFKDIMGGDIEDHIKTLSEDKRENYEILQEKPFFVSRGAGSIDVDLVMMRGPVYFLVEVKSSKSKTIHFSDSPRYREQVEEYIRISEEFDLPVIYSRRKKGVRGEKWELFRIRSKATREKCWSIPTIPKTKNGNRKLEWERGLPLSTFLHIIFNGDDDE